MTTQIPIITIDGPGCSGKGTISCLLAKRFNWHFLDSGIIYRVLALTMLRAGLTLTEFDAVLAQAQHLNFIYQLDPLGKPEVYINNENVTDAVRSTACGELASQISVHKEIRAALLDRQREFLKPPGLIADGRDMGTIVFPHAPLKIFLMASLVVRGERRHKQLQLMGINVSLEQVLEELKTRDMRDAQRCVAPLVQAADAVLIDTTQLSIDEVLNRIIELAVTRNLIKSGGLYKMM